MSLPIRSKILVSSSDVNRSENSGRRSYSKKVNTSAICIQGAEHTLRRNADAKDANTKWPIKQRQVSPVKREPDHNSHRQENSA